MSALMLFLADFPPSLWNGIDRNNIGLSSITQLIVNIIQIVISLAGVLAVAFIIYGGILYIISAGNPQTVNQAKTTLTNAIVGLIFVVLAYTIVGYIASLFG